MKDQKEKILILFEGQWLAYSPTVIQLYNELIKKYFVVIFAEKPKGNQVSFNFTHYFKYEHGITRYFYKLYFITLSFFSPGLKHFKIANNTYQDYCFRFSVIKKILRKNKFKKVICVDIKNLFYCSMLRQRCDFLSLEICLNENLLPYVDPGIIDKVIIQREDRYKYLFKEIKLPTFFVQNAPVYLEIEEKRDKEGLIFTGTVTREFGIFYCLDYMQRYADEKMIILGGMTDAMKEEINSTYIDLIRENRLKINAGYLKNEDVVEFISGAEIGFCLYNFDTLWVKNYNYQTAPSGKVFKYLAAGVPVICNDIPGFDFVRSFQCGELLTDMSPESIRAAIFRIRKNYEIYVENGKAAAIHFSFDKAIQPYLDYVDGE